MSIYPSKYLTTTLGTRGVLTIVFNQPKRFNAWSPGLLTEMMEAISKAGKDADVRAAVLTGEGSYYCSGVDFGGALKPMHPATFRKTVKEKNEAMFNTYLDFPKPLIVAMNGPAIGAAVTSATLADAIVAAPEATLHTPFADLGIVPEGCSSVWFERIMGQEAAKKMLDDGWKPTAEEALRVGLVQKVVPREELLSTAVAMAEEWADSGRPKRIDAEPGLRDRLKKVNADESVALAESFLGKPFLSKQADFFSKRGKTQLSLMFRTLALTRPLWSKL